MLTTVVTALWGRNVGIGFLILVCLFYTGANYILDKKAGESAVVLAAALLISGLMAVTFGYILTNYILEI